MNLNADDNFSISFDLKNALIDVDVEFTDNEVSGLVYQLIIYQMV